MRADQQSSGPEQAAVMQACQREIGFSIDGGEPSAGEQPHSLYSRVGGGNHFAQRTYPALGLGIVNLSEVYFLTSVQGIGIAMGPKVRTGFIGTLRQSSGSSQQDFELLRRAAFQFGEKQRESPFVRSGQSRHIPQYYTLWDTRARSISHGS